MNPYYPAPCPPVPNPAFSNTKRFSRQKNWERPQKTETDNTRGADPGYKFRLGGLLAMKHTDYVVLSNGSLTWSVPKKTEHDSQKFPTRFYRILTPYEMQQKKADQNRQESDEKQIMVSQQMEELEKQKAEIEKLKRVIVKMSKQEQLSAENQTVISSASRQNVKGKGGKNV